MHEPGPRSPLRGQGAPSLDRSFVVRNATVVTMDQAIGDFAAADIVVVEGSIRSVEHAARRPVSLPEIDGTGMIVIPGFCDPHIHSWEGALGRIIPNNIDARIERGKAVADGDGPMATRNYQNVAHRVFAPLYTPEDIYIGTLATLLAALDGGITTVCDNMHNSRSIDHSEASVRALEESGVRGIHSFGRPRYGPWEGDLFANAAALKSRHFSSPDQLTTMRFWVNGNDDPEEFDRVLRMREELDTWLTVDGGIGLLPFRELYASGRFDGRETLNHAEAVSDRGRREVRDGGSRVNVCPRIETQFRHGFIPYREWRDSGVEPAISNDNPMTYAIDMFAEMRTLYGAQRAEHFRDGTPEEAPTLREVLNAATVRGADNCGLGAIAGSITPGKAADLVFLRADDLRLTPLNNVLGSIVQGADIGLVDSVVVGGRIVKWAGRLVSVDTDSIRRQLQASQAGLLERANWPLDPIDFTD